MATSIVELALNAKLPIIKVRTEDTLNVNSVLAYLVDEPVDVILDADGLEKSHSDVCMAWTVNTDQGEIESLYTYLVENEKVIVVVNMDISSPLVFDAGLLPTPIEMVRSHLSNIVAEDSLDKLMPSFGGLNLKEVAEVSRLAMAHYGSLTSSGVMTIRRLLMSRLSGLSQVDTEMEFYVPSPAIVKWLDNNATVFLTCREHRLIPRGLLFDGEPGTGKTLGAKHIANVLEVPLYLMDLGSMMGKYVGQSEGQLATALQQIDQEEPCVLLLDEVEKVFKMTDDNGVTSRMLSKLLWWLQEHRSRILTVMTTNDSTAIPPELYREGRVDKTIVFKGLDYDDACEFVKKVLKSFYHISTVKSQAKILVQKIQSKLKDQCYSHSELTQLVYDHVKLCLPDDSK